MNLSSVLKGGGLGLPLQLIAGAVEPALATAAGAIAAGTGGAPAGLVRSLAATAAAGAAKAAGARKSSTAKGGATSKATTAKKATTKASTTKASGYATRLPAGYAFLRDPKLSLEEKLSRFIGMLMTKSEQDLLRQMEKMAPGSTAAAGGSTGSTGGTSGKSSKVSLWGLVKSAIPVLGLASQVVGDTQLKALASQLSGPVLAAACTAIGMPQLAPLAQKFGPQLVGMLTKDVQLDLGQLVGGGAGANAGGGGSSGSAGSTGGAAKASGGDGTSEKAQLMELQRLQDRDKELFTLFSNMLRSLHDSRMVAIQNIR